MIRYAYDRKLGHVYYELMPGGELREVEPRVVLAALNAKPIAPADQPTDHWSPWLEWRGGPCPLPGDAIVSCRCEDGVSTRPGEEVAADQWDWSHTYGLGNILAFRYRADNPAGWLPRGEFIPPAELWDEGCPVRCEWTAKESPSKNWRGRFEHIPPETWGYITHIRLVARQPQAGLPEGFGIDEEGALWSTYGPAFSRHDFEHHGPAAIRQAVDAWLREMGDE